MSEKAADTWKLEGVCLGVDCIGSGQLEPGRGDTQLLLGGSL